MQCSRLPEVRNFHFYDQEQGSTVEFRLIYQGPLPADRAGEYPRAADKQRIRKVFHPQLRELWNQHPNLRDFSTNYFLRDSNRGIMRCGRETAGAKTWVNHLADDHTRCGGRFVPLVNREGGFTCSLDILFLRRDGPGGLVENGGDIDNRIKVLIDGLRIPETLGELGGLSIETDEDPFFCLLENDNLLTELKVTTDRLVVPQTEAGATNNVLVVVHVTIVNPEAIFTGDRLV